jgi:L-lactate dehydrogenase complex protein LldG
MMIRKEGLVSQSTYDNLYTRFSERLSAAGGEAHRVADAAQAASFISAHPALEQGEVVIPPGFAQHPHWGEVLSLLRDKGIRLREAGTPSSVADAPAGLSSAELAIAETGSVLLAENSLEARVVSMLTLTHFVLVDTTSLVPMLDDAGKVLQQLTKAGSDQRHYISFVTGPSRTADIERTLTIGVQGPKVLCVLVVDN